MTDREMSLEGLILKSVAIGIVAFEVDSAKKIRIIPELLNNKAIELLGSPLDTERSPEDYLFSKSTLNPVQQGLIVSNILQMWNGIPETVDGLEHSLTIKHQAMTSAILCRWRIVSSKESLKKHLVVEIHPSPEDQSSLKKNDLKSEESMIFEELSKTRAKVSISIIANARDQMKKIMELGRMHGFETQAVEALSWMHTVKGQALVSGLDRLGRFLHEYEAEVIAHKSDPAAIRKTLIVLSKRLGLYLQVIETRMQWLIDDERHANLEIDSIRTFVDGWPNLSRHFEKRDVASPNENDVISYFYVELSDLLKQIGREEIAVSGQSLINPRVSTPTPRHLWVTKASGQIMKEIFFHLYTNSCMHGIELPALRRRLGKDERGQIVVRYLRQDDFVHIVWKDDGRGANPQKIKQKAIQRGETGLDNLSNSELIQFILHPEWSSARSVSEIAGRGIGLFEVQKRISELGGSFSVELGAQLSSQRFELSFRIKLPVTFFRFCGL